MWFQRTLLGFGLAALTAAGATAQTSGALRWRSPSQAPLATSPYGMRLHAGCGAIGTACEAETATTPLWVSAKARRALLMEVSQLEPTPSLRPSALNLSVVGKAGLPHDLGVYGRVGTYLQRSGPGLNPADVAEAAGMTYGMGMSWDFSRRGSASVGLDNQDLRVSGGDWRASLGLKWRY
ncbi:MAG: hypothetical protein ACO1OY_08140 [Ramlibacter sp.]